MQVVRLLIAFAGLSAFASSGVAFAVTEGADLSQEVVARAFHFFSESPRMNPLGVPSMQYLGESPYWEAGGQIGPMEWSTGSAFLAQTGQAGEGSPEQSIVRILEQARPARFAEVRVHPLQNMYRWEALAVQVGVMQTGSQNALKVCHDVRDGVLVTGPCEGPTSVGYYAGVQADLIEVIRKEPGHFQLKVGAGVTNIRPEDRSFRSLPYASVEVAYQLLRRVEAKAAMLASPYFGSMDWGIAAPALKVEIHL